MSSFVKYRIKEVAADLGVTTKEISAIVEQYFEKPKSTAQILEENQLNLIFDLMTQRNQIPSVEVVFAAAFAAKEAEEKKKAEEAAIRPQRIRKRPEKPSLPPPQSPRRRSPRRKSLRRINRSSRPPRPRSRSASASAGLWTPPPCR